MAVVQSTPKEEEVDQAQFGLKIRQLQHQAMMQSLAKDCPGAIAAFTEMIELTEGYMGERPEMAAALGPMLPELYSLRALEWHTLSLGVTQAREEEPAGIGASGYRQSFELPRCLLHKGQGRTA